MSILEKIKQAEEDAAQLKSKRAEDARSEAEAIESAAVKKGAELKAKAKSDAEEILKKANAESESIRASLSEQTQKECEDISKTAQGNESAAVDEIYKRILQYEG